MAGLKIVLWNSGGLCATTPSTPLKMGFYDKEFPNANFTVAAFVETHHKTENDFPDLIQDYALHNHVIHSPRTPEQTHTGIIVLISEAYDILQSKTIIPGRMINVIFIHNLTGHEYNLSVYYGYRLANLRKADILQIVGNFTGAHHLGDNNIIIGDFNFVDADIDKGKGSDNRDKIITPPWETFKSAVNLQDPFRIQFPTKVAYSFVAPAGKSRGDRVFVNEENVQTVTRYTHHQTPFNLVHKVISFTLSDQQERGPIYWKMNSSVLRDRPYVIMIEETVNNINNLEITDARTWWDIFLTCVRSKTVTYTKRKHFLDANIRKRFSDEMVKLEAIPQDMTTAQQHNRYRTLQESLKGYEEKEIEGYRTRTRGLPKYEMHEPSFRQTGKTAGKKHRYRRTARHRRIRFFGQGKPPKDHCQVLHPTIHFISNK